MGCACCPPMPKPAFGVRSHALIVAEWCHGARNIQTFMKARFGRLGTGSFKPLIGVRLLSEVFANLLVVGIVFGATGSLAHAVAILAVAGTLGYSMHGAFAFGDRGPMDAPG